MTQVKIKSNPQGGYDLLLFVDNEVTKREHWDSRREAMASANQWANMLCLDQSAFEPKDSDYDGYDQFLQELYNQTK